MCNGGIQSTNTKMFKKKIQKHSAICILRVIFFIEYVPEDGRKKTETSGASHTFLYYFI